jgi:pyruvate dehydrogenase E2 component (dihydrolipoamide acetyltransferase)
MSIEFKLPELGENVDKGDVIRVLVEKGDAVAKDQAVLELETDKATIEVPSSVGGTVEEVRVKAGDKVTVGQVVLVLDGSGNGAGSSSEAGAAGGRAEPEGTPLPPAQGAESASDSTEKTEDVREGTEAAPKSGSRSENVVDIKSGRQTPSRPEPAPEAAAPAPAPEAPAAAADAGAAVPAAPSVRRFARELGVDIAQVAGSGPGGRIGQDDVTQHVKARMTGPAAGGVRAAAPLPDFSKWGGVEIKPMSNIRRKTAEHLSQAWQAPHVTQHDKADVTGVEAFREAYGRRVEQAGGKLTVTAVLIRLLAAAIDRFPQFASSVDMANESIVFKHYRHIGVAVDTPNGLLVPVVRDAGRKSITDIAVELGTLSQKARDRKLTLDEMAGAVMTVTNLGGIGGTSFTPIVNQPEVAILGVSRTATEPVWADGQFVPRPMLPLSLSYDHRVIDGADAARFLRFLAEGLEQPLTMYL